MTFKIAPAQLPDSVSHIVSVSYRTTDVDSISTSVSNVNTTEVFWVDKTIGGTVYQFVSSQSYVIGEIYSVLAQIWDNEEDDAAFASL